MLVTVTFRSCPIFSATSIRTRVLPQRRSSARLCRYVGGRGAVDRLRPPGSAVVICRSFSIAGWIQAALVLLSRHRRRNSLDIAVLRLWYGACYSSGRCMDETAIKRQPAVRAPRLSICRTPWRWKMMKRFLSRPVLSALCVTLMLVPSYSVFAQEAAPQEGQDQGPPPAQMLPPQQLDNLVAPIALYPDALLSQVLVASTYPLEIAEAAQ